MKTAKGFTLVEMLGALAIGGIALGLGVDSMQGLVTDQRVASYAGDLLQTVHNARQYAIMKHKRVTVCASEDGQSCGGDWSSGHLIFLDHNGDRELDEEDEILNHGAGSNGRDPVYWRSFRVADTLQFLPTGITNHQNGTLTVCGLGKVEHARAVIIAKMGRPRRSKDSNADGVDEGADGRPLRC